MRHRRRNVVAERHALLIAAVAGLTMATAPSEPTGHRAVDISLLAASGFCVAYAAASAPWWALGMAAAAATAISGTIPLLALGLVACALALVVGWRRENLSQLRGASAAITVNVLARGELDPAFGVTAAVGLAAAALLILSGLRRRPQRVRRIAWITGSVAAAMVALAAVAFLVEASAARSALTDGRSEAQLGIDAVKRGDYPAASLHFALAAEQLADAEAHFQRPWARTAMAVPVVSQHWTAASTLSADGRRSAEAAAAAAGAVDPDLLRVVDGQVDLAALASLSDPAAALATAIDELTDSVQGADSPWLVSTARDELRELAGELDSNRQRLDDASTAVALAPQMLGADGRRVYLVLFTTPSEARGLGGFIGNYAELTVDGGRIEMTNFGRVSDLELLATAVGVRVTGPADFLGRYGTFGFNTDGQGLVGTASWRNLSMSPDFPSVATVAAEMYPQLSGRAVDGVIAVDPFVLGELLGYTGPIPLSTVGFTIDSENAAPYILVEQYRSAGHVERIDALEEAAELSVEALLDGTIPGPNTLADDLGPYAADRRLAVWMAAPDEQDLMRRVGLLDEIPSLDGANGWAVTVTNAGGSKIDTFLQRDFGFATSTTDGTTTSTLTATFTNTAPTSGFPDYVIGNVIGLPTGSSRLYVSFYSALPLHAAVLDGRPLSLAQSKEAGWHVYSGYVTVPSGATATFALTFAGTVAEPDRVVTWAQPLATPPTIHG